VRSIQPPFTPEEEEALRWINAPPISILRKPQEPKEPEKK
jgi:hypothetical protein